jgi:D-alanyl-D-alanine carboxypeptidase
MEFKLLFKAISRLGFFVLLLSFNITTKAQNLSAILPAMEGEMRNYIETEMEKRQIPGLVLGISEGDNLVKVASFGLADVQNEGPVRDHTIFELASITKQFTAGAIMLLLQDGKLKLDDPICLHIKDCPDAWKPVTIKHLLNHTSGLPAMGQGQTGALSFSPMEYVQFILTRNITKDLYFRTIKTDPLSFIPGEQFSYSDIGYFLLGYIIDNITGDYRKFIQDRIFDPLGMTSSYFLDQISVHKYEARGYTLRDGEWVNIRRVEDFEIPSHYGIFSNVFDLQKWDAALNSNILFTDESKALMWADTQLTNGDFTGYGLGWHVNKSNGKLVIDHTGMTGTQMTKWVDDGVSFIVLTNLGRGQFDMVNRWGLTKEIASMLGYSILEADK